jgi:serine/threonine-protein kinase
MGEVFLAEHVQLRKRVVVKLLHESLVAFPKHVDRIRVEAEALGRLQHPSIVEVRDFVITPSGRPFIVMERLLGATLHQELREKGSLAWLEAVTCVRQVLNALEAAHALGIVHRDIKLDNIFIHQPASGARIAKVLDFGIAKIVVGAPKRAPKPLIATEEGVVVGTPRYVSPEAALGKEVDHRADIYSVGLVLYTLLAGRGPWDDEKRDGHLMVAQAMRKPEPPSAYATSPISPELEQIVMRALEKKPADRYQSAREFEAALEQFASTHEPPSAGPDKSPLEPANRARNSSASPPPDLHATLIDEPLFLKSPATADTRPDEAALHASQHATFESDATFQIREVSGLTEQLPTMAESPPDSTRTAVTPAPPRDPTELVRLEAALRSPGRSPTARLALVAIAGLALALLGWFIVGRVH